MDRYAVFLDGAAQGRVEFIRAVLVGGVDAHLMAAPGQGAGHFPAGLGGAAVARRKIGDDVEDAH